MKKYLFSLLMAVTLFSCSSESEIIDLESKVTMIVVNEGTFGRGTAALSAITTSGSVAYDIFRDVNERPLGDIAQSMTFINGHYFTVLNNSKKIEVMKPQSFMQVATINYEQNGSPRFIVPISNSEAIVSDLTSQLVRINTIDYSVVEYIPLTGAPASQIEKMSVIGNKLFGATSSKGVAVFDTNDISASTMRLVSGFMGNVVQSAKMITDRNNKLWVMSTASVWGTATTVYLNCIDPTTETVEQVIEIPFVKSSEEGYVDGCITGTDFYARMDTDRTKAKLYFTLQILSGSKTNLGAVFTLNTDNPSEGPKLYRELPGLGMMYGMGISPDGGVFLCDCLDYTAQRGFVREYRANGSVESIRVGIYPRAIHFTEYDK